MPSAQKFLDLLESAVEDTINEGLSSIDPCALYWIGKIREIVEDNIPELAHMSIGTVYVFQAKDKNVRAICTKENQKTWVLYETDDSSRPGCRWMLGHGWCTADNIARAPTQSYTLPDSVRIK